MIWSFKLLRRNMTDSLWVATGLMKVSSGTSLFRMIQSMNSVKIKNSDQEQTLLFKSICIYMFFSWINWLSLFHKYSYGALKSCGKKNFHVQEGVIITGTKELKYRNHKPIQGWPGQYAKKISPSTASVSLLKIKLGLDCSNSFYDQTYSRCGWAKSWTPLETKSPR